ncbi:MAG: HAD family hydrolase [Myxococcales bacterium]
MIDTLLFDLGGVLLEADPRRGVAALSRLCGRPEAELEELLLGVAKQGFDRGGLGEADFVRQVRRACRKELTLEQIREAWCAMLRDLPPMQEFADRLAARHPSYLLSNTDPLHLACARERVAALRRFRGFHPSCEAGCAKPESEYYRLAFRRFVLEPARCVLIDDRPENVEAIVSLGAAGIVHESAERTEGALAALGIRP